MTIILSLSKNNSSDKLWAAGPQGLFAVNGHGMQAVAQPQSELYCCGVTDDRVLVGGLPHGVAFSLDDGVNWQASWMDGVDTPVLCIAPDPRVAETGVVLAGSAGGGLLRSHNRGHSFEVCNFGLHDFTILALAWAPPAPVDVWPKWEVVFAATEEGIYRSPNGGRGWKRCSGADAVFQSLAIAPDFHNSGVVLAGTEEQGLWRSDDGGQSFSRVNLAPQRIDAVTALANGWLLSDENGLLRSPDGLHWQRVPNSEARLVLLHAADAVWAGGEDGVEKLSL